MNPKNQDRNMPSGKQRGSTADKGKPGQSQQSRQSGTRGASQQQQGQPGQRQPDELSGGKSPVTRKLSADQDMDDDTGLSNRANRQAADQIDEGSRQERQSNVGRRDDGTPD